MAHALLVARGMHVRDIDQKASDLSVRRLMATNVSTVRANDTLYKAARLMHDRDCGCVVVIDRDGHVTGIVTDRDVALAAYDDSLPLKGIAVATSMTRDPITIRADETLEEAMRLMRSQQIRRLPVIDGDRRLLGLLTLGDIVKVIASLRRKGVDPSASDALVETFAAIGERRPKSVASLVCST